MDDKLKEYIDNMKKVIDEEFMYDVPTYVKIQTAALFMITKLSDMQLYSKLLYDENKFEVVNLANDKLGNIFETKDDYLNENYYNGKFINICNKVSISDDKLGFFKSLYNNEESALSILEVMEIVKNVNKIEDNVIDQMIDLIKENKQNIDYEM